MPFLVILAAALLAGHLLPRLAPGTPVRRRFGTYNITSELTDEHALQDYRRIIAAGVHLFGVQESHMRHAEDFVPAGWGTVHRFGTVRGRCAIHYRRDLFRLLRWGNPLLHAAHRLTFRSATRYYVWGRFQDVVTGRFVTFIVVHFVPHADGAGGKGGPLTTMPRRRLVQLGITVLIRLVRLTSRGQVVVVGDWNVNLRADLPHHGSSDLVEQLGTAGLVPVARLLGELAPFTHGHHAAYDHAFLRVPRRPSKLVLIPFAQGTLPKGWSDHVGYWFDATWPVRRGAWTLAA